MFRDLLVRSLWWEHLEWGPARGPAGGHGGPGSAPPSPPPPPNPPGSGALILQKGEIRVINQTTCESLLPQQITPRMMCVGYLSGGVDACQVCAWWWWGESGAAGGGDGLGIHAVAGLPAG